MKGKIIKSKGNKEFNLLPLPRLMAKSRGCNEKQIEREKVYKRMYVKQIQRVFLIN